MNLMHAFINNNLWMSIAFIPLDEYHFTFPVRMNTFIHIFSL